MKAFAIFLLALALLAFTTWNMGRVYECLLCAFSLTSLLWFYFQIHFFIILIWLNTFYWILFKKPIRALVFNFRFKCKRVPIFYIFSCLHYLILIFFNIMTVFARARFITQSAHCKAFAIHFQTSWSRTFAC